MRNRPRGFYLLLLGLLLTLPTPSMASAPCWETWDETCQARAVLFGVRGGFAGWGALIAVRGPVVPGAGAVRDTPEANRVCSVTPSTGQGSGVNVRLGPDADAAVIGDIALGAYRPVSAISANWYQTTTRGGGTGFVAAAVTTLVGPCGDVPRFIVTR